MLNSVVVGDCINVIPKLPDGSIQAVICSPPYALQRKYDSIPEVDYPDWTYRWMEALKPKLTPSGSVLIVIRAHIREGEVSDYVLRTILKLRENGWKQNEELIWHKPDAPPLGSIKRPRRTWEHILWFSLTKNPFVDLYSLGKPSSRTKGFTGSQRFQGEDSPIAKSQNRELGEGVARIPDVVVSKIVKIERNLMHPAMFPTTLPYQLIQMFSRVGDVILDPFAGAGTTLVAAKELGRNYVGIEISEEYARISGQRLDKIV